MFKKELRLVVTEDCNYDCIFCHKEGMKRYEKPNLTADDYAFLFTICRDEFSWNEITITGGEPFVRKDIDEIIKKIYYLKGEITVVTNGELLNKHIDALKYVKRLNISIHTLNSDSFNKIVQKKNKLNNVLKNIAFIRNIYPYLSIRLNSVIIRNFNDSIDYLEEYISFAKKTKSSIKFLELYSNDKKEQVSMDEICSNLEILGFKYKNLCNISKREMTDGDTTIILSRVFCSNAFFQINPEEYCNEYNDLFITPEGNINICREAKEDISIYDDLKKRDEVGIMKKIEAALKNMGRNCLLCEDEKKLAINGGVSVFNSEKEAKFIHPKITPSIEKSVIDQLHKTISIYDNSDIVGKFEKDFANYHNTKYALTFNSGTAALWGMYEGIGLKQGDEVICPCYTFFATVTPIFFTGASPILVDCDSYGNIDVEQIKNKINNKTKAIMVTHMWGYPCKMDELKKIASENNLFLLEDCSHAHGASYKGKKVGSWGDAAVFSLQGQKIITGGEGGILITDNKEIQEKALLLGHYNKRCKQEIHKSSDLYKYAITGKGMKLRAHPIVLRIAGEYFKDIDKINKKKNEYADMIIKELKNLRGLEVIEPQNNCNNSWYAIILKYNCELMYGVSRERFVEALHKEGAIEVDIPKSTCPLNKIELFKNPNQLFERNAFEYNYKDTDFKNADLFYRSIIKLPVWYVEEDKEVVIKYIRAIKKVCKNIKELI